MESFEQRYDSMIKAIQAYAPHADMEAVERAVRYAAEKHSASHLSPSLSVDPIARLKWTPTSIQYCVQSILIWSSTAKVAA